MSMTIRKSGGVWKQKVPDDARVKAMNHYLLSLDNTTYIHVYVKLCNLLRMFAYHSLIIEHSFLLHLC